MLHGYTFEKNGAYFTRITGFDDKTVGEMTEHYIRYDDNHIHGNAMFMHISKTRHDEFYEKYDIIPIETLDEFNLITKIMY